VYALLCKNLKVEVLDAIWSRWLLDPVNCTPTKPFWADANLVGQYAELLCTA
jgi:hypothetical protein